MAFLPEDFEVPRSLETDAFRVRPITIHDLVKDYEAVMTNREHLWDLFGEAWGWPQADLTLEQDLIDLGWHQKEFQLRSSFDYAVMSPDEDRMLGCVYVDPPGKIGFDAEVYFWARQDGPEMDLERELGQAVRAWISAAWPFTTAAYPGRDIPWDEWEAMPDRTG